MKEMEFVCAWTSCLLNRLNELRSGDESRQGIEEAVGACSAICFEKNKWKTTRSVCTR